MKRNTLRILAGALLACTLGAQAQTAYPTQPVKWVVPYAPGGTTDVIARSLAVRMGQDLGQPVVVDNKPGAASIIGATFIARSAADGYTVGTADSGTLAFNPAMYSALSYNAEKDFSFIGGLGRMPLVLAVHPDFPARMPAAVVERLNKDLAAALRHTETRAKLEEIGIQPLSMTPQQFTDFVRSEQKLWAGVIRAANIRLD